MQFLRLEFTSHILVQQLNFEKYISKEREREKLCSKEKEYK